MKSLLKTRQVLPSNLLKISLLLLSTTITLNTCINLAIANLPKSKVTLNKWQLNPKSQQLEITLSANTKPEYFYLDQPPRLVVDLPNTQLGNVNTQKSYSGAIQKIRVSQFSPHITRLVIDLKPGTFVDVSKVKLQPAFPKNPTRWVLRPIFSHYNTTNSNQPSPSSLMTLPPPTTNLPTNQQPLVTAPPLNSQNPSRLSNLTIIPANSANSSENTNMITIPNSSANIPNSQNYSNQNFSVPIIEFGQPIPTTNW
ncbi:AMIN domain-containing protein [Anabaena aphanizomenioides LEGE 00250]|uniref:AMIN domain-containing protein n=1 Tax=Sphaerospermopsis aphanizomenoides LEGE 00250 TaxID=2777972 RepID=A0ABR9VBH4_9CYAN|nr:AMIN domain-containing protein [Sphaerospermopsis aphanizomenoides]MBE9235535.1 AMIN domain-containing protein [Sphaerospermopsis aphanizomenoides LEGE 00250]